jgi:phosphoglucomutase
MKSQEFGKQFILVNRQLAWAESPSEWEPAVKSMYRFLDKIENVIIKQKIDKTWSDLDLARLFAILLTTLAETGQYRHEAFVPNPEKESELNKRKLIEDEMMPMMAELRRRTAGIIKIFLSLSIFSPLKTYIRGEIFPIVEDMDISSPDRYMPFRVIQIGNVAERLYNFKIRTNNKRLVGKDGNSGLLKAIYDFKYLRFGTSGVRGLWERDFTEIRAKQVVQAICEYLTNKNLPGYLKGEDLSNRKIIIGYDSRLNAEKVAEWVTQICVSHGFKVDFANRDTPTPALVYWLTDYHTQDEVAGLINLTASHNPPEWQGIKFNPRQGWPAPTNVTDFIASRINEINILGHTFPDIDLQEYVDRGQINGFDPIAHYCNWVLNSGNNNDRISIDSARIQEFFSGKKVVIDEMHGASRGYLSKILGEIGVQHTVLHPERDPLITGLDYANPEEPYINGLKNKVKEINAYLGVGMDTDADRFGIVDQGGVYFRPNQILPMLVRYLGIDRGYKGRIIATQTGSPLLEVLAGMVKDNEENKPESNVIPAYIDHPFYHRRIGNREDRIYEHTFMVPVGIKYIEEQRRTDRRYRGLSPLPTNWRSTILIGGEESSGLTTKGHVTDKDGIWANLLIMDMLAYYGTRPEKPLNSMAEIWEDTVSISGLWESFGGKEDFENPQNHSNSGRADLDTILEVKENIINTYLDTFKSGEQNKLGDFEVVFAGGVRYDLMELRLRDSKGDDRHFLRIRASGTEPINRIYMESSDPKTAKAMLKLVLDEVENLIVQHIKNTNSDWVVAETLVFTDVSPKILSAVKEKISASKWQKKRVSENIQTFIDNELLEKRNVLKSKEWIKALAN